MKGKIKTIDVITKQWFDKYNGNTYFSARITINYGMKNTETIVMPFQYGYGSYNHECFAELKKQGYIKTDETSYYSFYDDNKIIVRYNNYPNCLKREVIQHGTK